MATYKNIKGFGIQYLDSDPATSSVGQVWYNSTTKILKGTTAGGATAGTWASGGALNAGRNGAGAFGTQTSAVVFGGQAPSTTATAELYNGSSWSTIPSMNNVAYRTSGIGTSGAGKQIGFFTSTEVEDWNGSGWTVGTAINTARATYNSAIGSVTAGLISGGSIASSPFPTGVTANVESWNGSSWTEVNNLNTGRNCASSGTQTAGLAISGGGYISAPSFAQVANVESWNGSTWTEVADVNLGRYGSGACGTATDSIFYTGEASTGVSANTESWNGSTWTEIANVANALVEIATTTSSPASLSIKIGGTGASALTEEWTAPEFVTKTFTVSQDLTKD